MELRFDSSFVTSLNLKLLKATEGKKGGKKNFSLDYHVAFDESEPQTFFVEFDIHVRHSGEFTLKTNFVAVFKTSDIITDEFLESPFPHVNAAAIAYPFLRSMVSTITLNSGFNPVILPTVNFTKFYSKEDPRTIRRFNTK